jgi:hypothetical protein
MKLLGFSIPLLFLPQMLWSQNLVPNPSFECGTDLCGPYQFGEPFSFHVCDWSIPHLGTTDVLSTQLGNKECYASMPYDGPFPLTHLGTQRPRTGNRFIGIWTYTTGGYTPYREYAQVKLNSPLITGEFYCAEMYVSLAETPHYASNNLGMYFSTGPDGAYGSSAPMSFAPQIIEKQVVLDMANWVRIYDTLKASEPFQYLTIGNFQTDEETASVFKGNSTDSYYAYSYYFMEDIRVEKILDEKFKFSGDTILCEGGVATVAADIGVENVRWFALPDTSTIIATGGTVELKPTRTTNYQVKASGCYKTIVDTIKLRVYPALKVNIGKDTTICGGTTLRLNATGQDLTFKWQDGSTLPYYDVSTHGKFSVTVFDKFNCSATDEVAVKLENKPVVNLGKDTLVCNGSLRLNAGPGAIVYSWSNGFTDSVYVAEQSGKYWVVAKNKCGVSSDTITIYTSSDIFVPNVVTANGDNYNEDFKVALIEPNTSTQILDVPLAPKVEIYNIWGTKVYSNSNYINEWPRESQNLPSGTYYYLMNLSNCFTRKGWVHLMKN